MGGSDGNNKPTESPVKSVAIEIRETIVKDVRFVGSKARESAVSVAK